VGNGDAERGSIYPVLGYSEIGFSIKLATAQVNELKSIHLSAYRAFQQRLIEVRSAAGVTQADLAKKLGKPQSFVSKIEAGDRRLDVAEYVLWMMALEAEPNTLINELAAKLEQSRSRRLLDKRKS
jgi:DNA-binding transcriptional regulator YiaG